MTTAQSYKAKKYAMRAAARALQTPQNLKAVEKVADLYENEGRWFWKERNEKIVDLEPVKQPVKSHEEVLPPMPPAPKKKAPKIKAVEKPVVKEEKKEDWPPHTVTVNGKTFELTEKDRERMKGGTPSKSGFMYSRPKAGTKGAEIWSWCDKFGSHKAVQEMGKINGHNPTSVSGVYSNWIHRDE